ncbi:hypothetical protein [Sediminibacillus halophilus]|uniref:DUF3221 domain-containing protein n=1 Tax=Sediminibacillus halophilus TaxID=482461 RepID=A0A1G9N4Z8_9BACI|nr:hypothetical protein [Sediminibacillus halophilus]SDL81187.1 hypothetical protein SAMN05216244_0839 [Sediminibacillus halophilus]
MHKILLMVALAVSVGLLTGCQQNNVAEKIDVEGEVTLIDDEKQLLYIDGNPIMVENPEEFKVGQQVTAELIDTNPDKDWDPEQIVVENIEFNK